MIKLPSPMISTASALVLARGVGLAVLVLGQAHAQAQVLNPAHDRLSLSTSASIDVNRDVLSITFSVRSEGNEANAVQNALKQSLDAALAEARKQARPGELDVQTGNFSMSPRYTAKNGQSVINGWTGYAEMTVEGKDIAAISALSGRITTMSIARVGFSLSREAREKHEGEVAAQAITRFKAKAAEYARQFGFSGYQIGDVTVNTQDAMPFMMAAPQVRMKAAAMADEPLPVEAGKATLSVNVSGAVQMTAR